MAIPWLIGAAVVGIGAAIAARASDGGYEYRYDSDEEEQKLKAKLKREISAKEQRLVDLSQEFDDRCQSAQDSLGKAIEAYVSLEFRGHVKIDKRLPIDHPLLPNFFGQKKGGWREDGWGELLTSLDDPTLEKVAQNLDYIQQMYDVDAKPTIRLHHVEKEIQSYDQLLTALDSLRNSIQQTINKVS